MGSVYRSDDDESTMCRNQEPLRDNATEKGRALNRRAERAPGPRHGRKNSFGKGVGSPERITGAHCKTLAVPELFNN